MAVQAQWSGDADAREEEWQPWSAEPLEGGGFRHPREPPWRLPHEEDAVANVAPLPAAPAPELPAWNPASGGHISPRQPAEPADPQLPPNLNGRRVFQGSMEPEPPRKRRLLPMCPVPQANIAPVDDGPAGFMDSMELRHPGDVRDFAPELAVEEPEPGPQEAFDHENFEVGDQQQETGFTVLLSELCDMQLVDYAGWPSFFQDMTSSVEEECRKFGEIRNCFPDCGGVHAQVWVCFATEDAAEECCKNMNGATFAGTQIKVEHVDFDGNHESTWS
ncbi:Cpox, partial [Symbiodinium natans]